MLIVICIKPPVNMMVSEVIASDGDIISSFTFPHGVTLKMEIYIKCVEEVVLPYVKKEAARRLQFSFAPIVVVVHMNVIS